MKSSCCNEKIMVATKGDDYCLACGHTVDEKGIRRSYFVGDTESEIDDGNGNKLPAGYKPENT